MEEVWKAVPGYEGLYEVSNRGQVRSLDREVLYSNGYKRIHKGKTLKPKHDYGYPRVMLQGHGKKVTVSVHILVLTSFVRPRKPHEETRHLNGVRHDNRLENLAWGTPKENGADRVAHGNQVHGERVHTCLLQETQVREIKRLLREGARVCDLVRRYGVRKNVIIHIKKGRSWKHVP